MKKTLVFLSLIGIFWGAKSQDQLKVMSYNLLNYGNITTYCTATNNPQAAKEIYLRKIVSFYQPDILGVCEMYPSNTVAQSVLTNVLNINGSTKYKRANLSNQSSSDLMNMVYYNSYKLNLYKQTLVNTATRDIVIYSFNYKKSSGTPIDTFHCIIAHLKAGPEVADQADRTIMTQNVMNYIQNNMPIGNYFIMGDFNVQSSAEDAFQKLINPTNSSYKFVDPINKLGSWTSNSSYANIHTQSTHTTSNGCAASGGMDDRFDFILVSQSIMNGSKGIKYVSNSYKAFGNDGNHYNNAINSGTNNSVPDSVLTSLYEMSDHLPVVMSIQFDTTATGIDFLANRNLDFWFENPIQEKLIIHIDEIFDQKMRIEIFDISGKILLTQILEEEISIGNLNKGIYFIKLTSSNGMSKIKKLVKF